jgi:hypothetical protein
VQSRPARLLTLAAGLGVTAFALVRARPPEPVPADTAQDTFSAGRAVAVVGELLGDGAAHPVGSPANDAVRERLLARLRTLGVEPELQRGFACSESGSCATVTNVLVWLPGQVAGPAVALAAHYDSVPAGPGAADDMHGVAIVLEALRLLRDVPRRNPLVLVFTDGEEAGLLGARLFADHPRAGELGVVLNVEARGTTGASRMFETSDGNAALIAALARAPRPSAQSLSYEVYRRLPNDTDLTVFKQRGAQGMNFGFIAGLQRYHTPRDDLAHLDPGSVQQQGDAMIASARALLAADLSQRPAHNAHYVDLFAAVLLRWPAWLDLPLVALALLALLTAAVRRRRELSARAELLALAAALVAPLAATAGAWTILRVIEATSGPLGPWPAALQAAVLTASLAASAAVLALATPLVRRAGPLATSLVVWTLWTLAALVLTATIPGAAILFLVPALIAALIAVPRLSALAPALAALAALALWSPLVPGLIDALGLSGLLLGPLVGLLWTALLPACAEGQGARDMSRITWLVLLLALAGAALTARAPRVDADHPAKCNYLHLTDLDAGTALLVADAPAGLPRELAGPWDPPAAHLPWSAREVPSLPAEPTRADGPTLTRLSAEPAGDRTRVTLDLRTRPGALAAQLLLPEGSVSALTVGARPLDPTHLRRGPGDAHVVTIHGPSPDGTIITADLTGPHHWQLVELVAGLPPGTTAPERPAHVVPYQMGDLTAVRRTVAP